MAFISYGRIDKKLLWVLFMIIAKAIFIYVSTKIKAVNGILVSFMEEIGAIIFGVILHFIFRQKNGKSKKGKKRSIIHLLIIFLFRAIECSFNIIFPYFERNREYLFSEILNTTNGLEIIVITGGTFLMLNYKYYIHHFISMIVFCALGISMDIIIKSFLLHFKYIYFYIIIILNEVLVYCYLKYMMDKLYYKYTEIIIYWGLIGLTVYLFIYSGLSLYEYINDIDGYIFKVRKYFTDTSIVSIIFQQIIYYIFQGGIYYSLMILLLFYLRPNHMIIADEIQVYLVMILFKKKPNKAYSVIPFAFQILALLFYFEILELNFCGLNKNTAKNIEARGNIENDINNDTDNDRNTFGSNIELEGQYLLKASTSKSVDDIRSSLANNFYDGRNSINDNE